MKNNEKKRNVLFSKLNIKDEMDNFQNSFGQFEFWD
jgi:hypothetical protein